MDIQSIFNDKKLNISALLSHQFVYTNGVYSRSFSILEGTFKLSVVIDDTGILDYHVIDSETGEEYILAKIVNAQGQFVGTVISECERVIQWISEECYEDDRMYGDQANVMMEYMKTRFHVEPEFLWKKHPRYAVLRHPHNEKWFAIIMSLAKHQLGIDEDGTVDVINLKNTQEKVQHLVDHKHIFPAYHMNKKYWYSICLDNRLSDEEIMLLIDTSYQLIDKNK